MKLLRNLSKAMILTVLLLSVHSAFAANTEMTNAQNYVTTTKQLPSEPSEPLPQFLEPKPFPYTVTDMRSPFKAPNFVLPGAQGQPDINRPKEQLEAFTLDSLQMVGTLSKNNKIWVLIQAPNGVIYRVAKGTYLGKDYGQIINILKDKIEIVETVPDGSGGWKKRDTTLVLASGNKKSSNAPRPQ